MGSGLSKHPDEVRREQQQQQLSQQAPLTTDSSTARLSAAASSAPPAKAPNEPASSPPETGGCPMKRTDGSYSFDWKALLRPDFPHKQGMPTAEVVSTTADKTSVEPLPQQNDPPTAGATTIATGGGGCPVKSQSQHPQYNVYSQPLDPSNNMPQVANQLPAPNQRKPLSTERVSSSIPKGGSTGDDNTTTAAASTWTYPSPQMFYNALARKGKLGDTTEDDIANVVTLHNHMNEKTWRKVLQWEQVVESDAENDPPKLLRFQGRPSDLSPKAAFKYYLLGHPLPYDRHDWTIVHEHDGSTRRYVIDYYHDEMRSEGSAIERQDKDAKATPSLLVDVRPAADDVRSIWSRLISMPYARHVANSTSFEPLAMIPTASMKSQVQESMQVWQDILKSNASEGSANDETPDTRPQLTEVQARTLAREFAQVMTDCRAAQRRVNDCEDEMDCARASMDLTVCMGKIVCPLQHTSLTKALAESYDGDSKIEAALEVMNDCVMQKTIEHKEAKEVYPNLFTKS